MKFILVSKIVVVFSLKNKNLITHYTIKDPIDACRFEFPLSWLTEVTMTKIVLCIRSANLKLEAHHGR